MAELNQQSSEKATLDQVLWAFSIPAAWSDRAKRTLRHAAAAAGLISKIDSKYASSLHELHYVFELYTLYMLDCTLHTA